MLPSSRRTPPRTPSAATSVGREREEGDQLRLAGGQLADGAERAGEGESGGVLLRTDGEGLAIRSGRLTQRAGRDQRARQVVEGLGLPWGSGESAPIGGDRIGRPALGHADVAERGVGGRELLPAGERAAHVVGGGALIAAMMRRQPDEVQRIRLVRLLHQDRAVQPLGIRRVRPA